MKKLLLLLASSSWLCSSFAQESVNFATAAEAAAGSVPNKAISPATLQSYTDQNLTSVTNVISATIVRNGSYTTYTNLLAAIGAHTDGDVILILGRQAMSTNRISFSNNVSLIGRGAGSIDFTLPGDTFGNTYSMMHFGTNAFLSGLTIDANLTNTTDTLQILIGSGQFQQGITNITLRDCTLQGDAILFGNSGSNACYARFENCNFIGPKHILPGSGALAVTDPTNSIYTFKNCFFDLTTPTTIPTNKLTTRIALTIGVKAGYGNLTDCRFRYSDLYNTLPCEAIENKTISQANYLSNSWTLTNCVFEPYGITNALSYDYNVQATNLLIFKNCSRTDGAAFVAALPAGQTFITNAYNVEAITAPITVDTQYAPGLGASGTAYITNVSYTADSLRALLVVNINGSPVASTGLCRIAYSGFTTPPMVNCWLADPEGTAVAIATAGVHADQLSATSTNCKIVCGGALTSGQTHYYNLLLIGK